MTTVLNSTMGSSLPSMAIPYMMKEWGITSQTQSILPISTFLMGYVFGPIVCKLPLALRVLVQEVLLTIIFKGGH